MTKADRIFVGGGDGGDQSLPLGVPVLIASDYHWGDPIVRLPERNEAHQALDAAIREQVQKYAEKFFDDELRKALGMVEGNPSTFARDDYEPEPIDWARWFRRMPL